MWQPYTSPTLIVNSRVLVGWGDADVVVEVAAVLDAVVDVLACDVVVFCLFASIEHAKMARVRIATLEDEGMKNIFERVPWIFSATFEFRGVHQVIGRMLMIETDHIINFNVAGGDCRSTTMKTSD